MKQERASRSGSRNRRKISFRHTHTRSACRSTLTQFVPSMAMATALKTSASSLRSQTYNIQQRLGLGLPQSQLSSFSLPFPVSSSISETHAHLEAQTPSAHPLCPALSPKLRVEVPPGKRDTDTESIEGRAKLGICIFRGPGSWVPGRWYGFGHGSVGEVMCDGQRSREATQRCP